MFGRKVTTVEQAIAPLIKAADDLNEVALECSRKVNANKTRVEELESENLFASAEQDRATRIMQALEAIINPKE